LVNQQLLLRNEYLLTENRILKAQVKGRLRLSDGERSTLAEIAKRLGHKALEEIALRCQTRDHSGLVSQTGRAEVRRLESLKKRGLDTSFRNPVQLWLEIRRPAEGVLRLLSSLDTSG
jgi:hypothetical protein